MREKRRMNGEAGEEKSQEERKEGQKGRREGQGRRNDDPFTSKMLFIKICIKNNS